METPESHRPNKGNHRNDTARNTRSKKLRLHSRFGRLCEFPGWFLKTPGHLDFLPGTEEEDKPVTLVPEAVIEILSKGYEAKDLEIAPRFYLSQGVKDVVVFDPYTLVVLHVRKDRANRKVSPVEIEFECGCRLHRMSFSFPRCYWHPFSTAICFGPNPVGNNPS